MKSILLTLLSSFAILQSSFSAQPNIVFMYADNLGGYAPTWGPFCGPRMASASPAPHLGHRHLAVRHEKWRD
jgi:hypothetical protein